MKAKNVLPTEKLFIINLPEHCYMFFCKK